MSKLKLLVCYSIIFIFIFSALISIPVIKTTKAEIDGEVITVKSSTFIAPTMTHLLEVVEDTVEDEFVPQSLLSISKFEDIIEDITPTVEPTPEPTPEPVHEFTEEQIYLLAQLINAEAGVEIYKCKLAVGSVVLNRMADDKYPNTLEEVIFQRKPCAQFSVILKRNGVRAIDKEPSEDSIKAARELTESGSVLPKDILVFYAEYVDKGSWVTTRKIYKKIGRTIFAHDHR